MLHTPAPTHRWLGWLLGLTYVATGILSVLPGASLIQLASNTHVSLEVVSGMFTASALGFFVGAVLTGMLTASVKPNYLLATGLVLIALGSLIVAFASSFPLLLAGQAVKGSSFGFIDIALNTIATLTFKNDLNEKLNAIHGMFGMGALLGPALLAFGLQFLNALPFAYMIGAGIALITMCLILGQQTPEVALRKQEQMAPPIRWSTLLQQGLLWLMILQISLYACAEIGFGNWIVTVVSQSAALSLALAAPVATAFYLGLTVGRLGGAQVLRRGWLNETRLLYLAVFGGVFSGIFVALFPGQLIIVYSASALVGCFYGPLYPSIMAIASRRFVHAIGPVSSLMTIGPGIGATVLPTTMGLLIPVIGIHWVIAIPAILCCAVAVPMTIAQRPSRTTLQLSGEQHTMTVPAKLP